MNFYHTFNYSGNYAINQVEIYQAINSVINHVILKRA